MPHASQPSDQFPEDRESLDLIAEFTAQADVADTTRAKYRVHLEEFRRWLNHPDSQAARDGRRRQLVDATARDVQLFMAYLREPGRVAAAPAAHRGACLSASSRKGFFASLRSFYGYLTAVGIAPIDPTASCRAPRVIVNPGLHLSPDELRLLLGAPGSARDRVQTYLLAYTAARAGALRQLRWHDIDFHERVLHLHGKHGKQHTINIHPRLMSELRRWYIYQETEAQTNTSIRAAKAQADTDYVLLTRTGQPLPQNTITKQLKARATRIALHLREGTPDAPARSRVSAHTMRRSIATLLLNDGHHIDAVADLLGHMQVDTTRRHYAFSSNARRRATIEALEI